MGRLCNKTMYYNGLNFSVSDLSSTETLKFPLEEILPGWEPLFKIYTKYKEQ